MLGPLKPLKLLQPLQPIQPLQVRQMLTPIAPLTPTGNTTAYGYRKKKKVDDSFLRKPMDIDSLSDVLFNQAGKDQLAESQGVDLGTLPDALGWLAGTIISGVKYIQDQYAEPLLDGNITDVFMNALGALSEDLDVLSMPVKGAVIEAGSGWTEAIISGVAALAAGTAAVTTGGLSIPVSMMAASIAGGVTALGTSIAKDPSAALKGAIRGSGLGSEGKFTYNMDTGNFITNFLAEVALDPLNWLSFGADVTSNLAKISGMQMNQTMLDAIVNLGKMDKLVTSIAFYGNPLGMTFAGVSFLSKRVGSYGFRQAQATFTDYMAKGNTATLSETEYLLDNSLRVTAANVKDVRMIYQPTGELDFMRGNDDDVYQWFMQNKQAMVIHGVATRDNAYTMLNEIANRALTETSFDFLAEYADEQGQAALIPIVKDLLNKMGTNLGVARNYTVDIYARGKKAISEYFNAMMERSTAMDAVLSTASNVFAPVFESAMKEAKNFVGDATGVVTVAGFPLAFYTRLVERFPEFSDLKAFDSVDSPAVAMLNSMLETSGHTLAEIKQAGIDLAMNKVVEPISDVVDGMARIDYEATFNPKKLTFSETLNALRKVTTESLIMARQESADISEFFEFKYPGSEFTKEMAVEGIDSSSFYALGGAHVNNLLDDETAKVMETFTHGPTEHTPFIKHWVQSVESNLKDTVDFAREITAAISSGDTELFGLENLSSEELKQLGRWYYSMYTVYDNIMRFDANYTTYQQEWRSEKPPVNPARLIAEHADSLRGVNAVDLQNIIDKISDPEVQRKVRLLNTHKTEFGFKDASVIDKVNLPGNYTFQLNKIGQQNVVLNSIFMKNAAGYSMGDLINEITTPGSYPYQIIDAMTGLDISANARLTEMAQRAKRVQNTNNFLLSITHAYEQLNKLAEFKFTPYRDPRILSDQLTALDEVLKEKYDILEADAAAAAALKETEGVVGELQKGLPKTDAVLGTYAHQTVQSALRRVLPYRSGDLKTELERTTFTKVFRIDKIGEKDPKNFTFPARLYARDHQGIEYPDTETFLEMQHLRVILGKEDLDPAMVKDYIKFNQAGKGDWERYALTHYKKPQVIEYNSVKQTAPLTTSIDTGSRSLAKKLPISHAGHGFDSSAGLYLSQMLGGVEKTLELYGVGADDIAAYTDGTLDHDIVINFQEHEQVIVTYKGIFAPSKYVITDLTKRVNGLSVTNKGRFAKQTGPSHKKTPAELVEAFGGKGAPEKGIPSGMETILSYYGVSTEDITAYNNNTLTHAIIIDYAGHKQVIVNDKGEFVPSKYVIENLTKEIATYAAKANGKVGIVSTKEFEDIMDKTVYATLKATEGALETLKASGHRPLIYVPARNDKWGVFSGKKGTFYGMVRHGGQNQIGRSLMRIRAKLNKDLADVVPDTFGAQLYTWEDKLHDKRKAIFQWVTRNPEILQGLTSYTVANLKEGFGEAFYEENLKPALDLIRLFFPERVLSLDSKTTSYPLITFDANRFREYLIGNTFNVTEEDAYNMFTQIVQHYGPLTSFKIIMPKYFKNDSLAGKILQQMEAITQSNVRGKKFDNNKVEFIDSKGRSYTGEKRVTRFTTAANAVNHLATHGQTKLASTATRFDTRVKFSDKKAATKQALEALYIKSKEAETAFLGKNLPVVRIPAETREEFLIRYMEQCEIIDTMAVKGEAEPYRAFEKRIEAQKAEMKKKMVQRPIESEEAFQRRLEERKALQPKAFVRNPEVTDRAFKMRLKKRGAEGEDHAAWLAAQPADKGFKDAMSYSDKEVEYDENMNLDYSKIAESMTINHATPPLQFRIAQEQDRALLSKKVSAQEYLNYMKKGQAKVLLDPANVTPQQEVVLPFKLNIQLFGEEKAKKKPYKSKPGVADVSVLKDLAKMVEEAEDLHKGMADLLRTEMPGVPMDVYQSFRKQAQGYIDSHTEGGYFGARVVDPNVFIEPVPGYPLKQVEGEFEVVSEEVKAPVVAPTGKIRVVSQRKGGLASNPDETVIIADRKNNKVLSNPFRLNNIKDDVERDSVIAKHKDTALAPDIRAEGPIYQEMVALAERVKAGEKIALACWCAPKPCHLDEIAKDIYDMASGIDIREKYALSGTSAKVSKPMTTVEKGLHYEDFPTYKERVQEEIMQTTHDLNQSATTYLESIQYDAQPHSFVMFPEKEDQVRFINFMKNLMLELDGMTPTQAALYVKAMDYTSRILAFPGLSGENVATFVKYAKRIIDNYIADMAPYEHQGAVMGMWPSEADQRDLEKMVKEDIPYIQEVVNDKDVQRDAHKEQMNQFQSRYVSPENIVDLDTGESHSVLPPVRGILPGFQAIKKVNRNLSRYYVTGMSSNKATDINTSSNFFGMVRPDNSAHLNSAIKFQARTGRKFSNKTVEAHASLHEYRSTHPSAGSYAQMQRDLDVTLSIQQHNTIDVPLGLVEEQLVAAKIMHTGVIPEGHKGSEVADVVNSIFLNNTDVLRKVEKLQNTSFEYAGEVQYMTTFEGNDVLAKRSTWQLENLNAQHLAQVIYQQPLRLMIIPLSTHTRGFTINVLNDLKAYGIEFKFNGRFVWFKGPKGDEVHPGEVDWKMSQTTSDMPEPFVEQMRELHTQIQLASATRNPIDVTDRVMRRYDGRKLATYLVGQGILAAEDADEFAEILQNTIADFMPIVADSKIMLEIDSEAAATPLGSLTGAALGMVQRGAQKMQFFHRIEVEHLDVNEAFRVEGDPVRVSSEDIFDRMQKMPGLVFAVVDRGDRIVKVVVNKDRKVGIKDIEIARGKGAFVTTNQTISKLIPLFNNGKLPPLLAAINKIFNGMYKAGFLTSIAFGMRNIVDTNLVKNMLGAHSDTKIFEYEVMARRMIKDAQEDMLKIGNLYNADDVANYIATIPPERALKLLIILSMLDEVSPFKLETMIDISRMQALATKLQGKIKEFSLVDAMTKLFWGNPMTKAALALSQFGEQLGRISLLMYCLVELKMGAAEAADYVNRIHFNYAQKSEAVTKLSLVVLFAQYPLENFILWADEAMENPWLFRLLLQLGTQSWQDEEQRRKRALSEYETSQAMSGNMKIGSTLVKMNPSLFDALALIPGLLTDPTERLSPVITNVGKLLQGDFSGLEYPFEQNLKRVSDIVTKTVPQILGGDIERLPDLIPSGFRTDTDYKNTYTNAHSRYSNAGYNLYYAKGSTKMGIQYGMNRIGRSSTYVRKVYLGKGFYNSLYAKSGSSRIKLRMSAPTSKNLAMRIADQNYRFK